MNEKFLLLSITNEKWLSQYIDISNYTCLALLGDSGDRTSLNKI